MSDKILYTNKVATKNDRDNSLENALQLIEHCNLTISK